MLDRFSCKQQVTVREWFSWQRIAGAIIALVVQIAVLYVLSPTIGLRHRVEGPEHVIYVALPQIRTILGSTNASYRGILSSQASESAMPHIHLYVPRLNLLSMQNMHFYQTVTQPTGFSGLATALFGCPLDGQSIVTAETSKPCLHQNVASIKYDPETFHRLDISHARYAQRWSYELGKEKGPLLLPCMNPSGLAISVGTLVCIGDLIVNGYHPDHDYFGSYQSVEGSRKNAHAERMEELTAIH